MFCTLLCWKRVWLPFRWVPYKTFHSITLLLSSPGSGNRRNREENSHDNWYLYSTWHISKFLSQCSRYPGGVCWTEFKTAFMCFLVDYCLNHLWNPQGCSWIFSLKTQIVVSPKWYDYGVAKLTLQLISFFLLNSVRCSLQFLWLIIYLHIC